MASASTEEEGCPPQEEQLQNERESPSSTPIHDSFYEPLQLSGDISPSDSLPPRDFDPSRMVGIIRRKALIRELAGVYHAECLSYCQQLLELQRKWQEQPCVEIKNKATEIVKRKMKPPKRKRK